MRAKLKVLYRRIGRTPVLTYFLLICVSFVFLYPFLYLVITSLKSPEDLVFSKPTFGSLELADYLRDKGDEYESVELAGVVTNICVISNMVLAKAAMPEVPILIDAACVASNDDRLGEAALAVMETMHVKVKR